MSFEEIKTQEELDKIIKERLDQKERSVKKLYEGYIAPDKLEEIKKEYQKQIDNLNTKYSDFDKQVDDYKNKIAKYETDSVKTEVAIEMGIPLELRGRLVGSTREEIEEDARKLSEFTKRATPSFSNEPNMTKDDIRKATLEKGYRDLVKNM